MKKVWKKASKEGRIEGRKEGLAEGRREQTLVFARQMKANKEPLDKIAQYTGLTVEEIEKLL